MIVKVIVENKKMPYGIYGIVHREEFLSREQMRNYADDMADDGFWQEASWWDRRARETPLPRFIATGCSCGDVGGVSTHMFTEREMAAYRRLVQRTVDKKRASIMGGNVGRFEFVYCEY